MDTSLLAEGDLILEAGELTGQAGLTGSVTFLVSDHQSKLGGRGGAQAERAVTRTNYGDRKDEAYPLFPDRGRSIGVMRSHVTSRPPSQKEDEWFRAGQTSVTAEV
ncbi:hypothetical protein BaRGS_00019065 [Batillaria attramentaria]|uniref:Uncharacterized protein n=1 Tax=Batillaria attramentaria TaxID=370345 RepID=A0ABD0KSB3_9CAEN